MSKNNRKSKKKSRWLLKKIFDTGVFLLIVLVITYILSNYVVERIKVYNHSMEPTVYSDDVVFVDKLTYRISDVDRFDIIVFAHPASKENLIKRVIGLPGETIQIIDGRFVVDGNPILDIEGLVAPYYEGIAARPVYLNDDEYFVVGDNRDESIDSRYEEVGLIKQSDVVGKMFLRLLPLKDIRFY